MDADKAAELKEQLKRMRRSLASRLDQGDQLEVPREVEHFVLFGSREAVAEATARLRHAGWDVEVTEDGGGRGSTMRAYREEAVDAGTAEHSVRTVFAIATEAGGSYDGYGARIVFADNGERPGFLRRILGQEGEGR
ncbi:ribonuclease E inhibitor RraB [Paeniglutamicibacter cryotolerans]|uniref:Regulator of RNase E activity RraB n=1 Tax=Paeniglutamicibacter cryotolerans TaxID=670079 RepID=A0A839QJZ6_9MICC|nr:ribonuclease E inhibitor RraB [Paeniglutamicibacter cryotolerans]MBB2994865.1 regulator of RNase E activity RraB [Paeniglutamicibacter cryotolerans]